MKRHSCTSALVMATQTVLNQPMILSGPQQANRRTNLSNLLPCGVVLRGQLFSLLQAQKADRALCEIKLGCCWGHLALFFAVISMAVHFHGQAWFEVVHLACRPSHIVSIPFHVVWQRAQLGLHCRLGAVHVCSPCGKVHACLGPGAAERACYCAKCVAKVPFRASTHCLLGSTLISSNQQGVQGSC